MRFDFVDLRLFLFVAESGSITLGAERAGLALASASARKTSRPAKKSKAQWKTGTVEWDE